MGKDVILEKLEKVDFEKRLLVEREKQKRILEKVERSHFKKREVQVRILGK